MTNRSRKTTPPRISPPLNDEGSSVRARASDATGESDTREPRRMSDPNFSLDERLEAKLSEAASLLARLESNDARARLLHIAMLRRDEALLDGILAELSLPPRPTHRPR